MTFSAFSLNNSLPIVPKKPELKNVTAMTHQHSVPCRSNVVNDEGVFVMLSSRTAVVFDSSK